MIKLCRFDILHRLLIVFSFSISACSLQPVKNHAPALDPNLVPAPSPEKTPSRSIAIEKEPKQPMPVAPLEPDPVRGTGTHVEKQLNIWKRVRSGFAMDATDYDDVRIAYYKSWYRAEPDYLYLVTGRAAPYLYFILQEIARRHLPTELALLPIIESAYVPFAYSRSHAAGIWQFIPGTGRSYGLKQNWWYDGRRDVYASTLAALDYLKALNQLFKGDWLHTLAAYNAGPNRVLAEIEKNTRLGEPTDFWHLNLPRQTRNYVPKLLAVKALIEDPAKFGIRLWPVPDKPYLAVIDIETQIDLGLAAKLAGMNVKSFQRLNPGFNQWATDPDGPHQLLLPINRAKDFKLKLAELPSPQRVARLHHDIKAGETLTYLAHRYGTSVNLLQQTNALHDSRILAGDRLLIPQTIPPPDISKLESTSYTSSSLVENQQSGAHIHVVRRGDSLWSIARSYEVDVSELAVWNDKALNSALQPGDQLLVWGNSRANSSRAKLASAIKTNNYSVAPDDSLYAIARRLKVSIAELRRWNYLHDNTLLHCTKKRCYIQRRL